MRKRVWPSENSLAHHLCIDALHLKENRSYNERPNYLVLFVRSFEYMQKRFSFFEHQKSSGFREMQSISGTRNPYRISLFLSVLKNLVLDISRNAESISQYNSGRLTSIIYVRYYTYLLGYSREKNFFNQHHSSSSLVIPT